ncbi:hypothetical protein [Geodermatophilus sp. URMC 64]
MTLARAVNAWGATDDDLRRPLPCDRVLPDADVVLHRAVDVAAPPELVFRWLCQLRAAPYSYDVVDNLGRRSPQRLTPGLDRLAVGQPAMRVFRVVCFERPEHLTVDHRGVFGRVAVTYAVSPRDGGAHLLMRIRWTPPALPLPTSLTVRAMALGDLVMARRQLRNLQRLAERDAAAVAGSRPSLRGSGGEGVV